MGQARLDQSFGTEGIVSSGVSIFDGTTAIVEDRKGQLVSTGVLSGQDFESGCSEAYVARHLSNGQLDMNFHGTGFLKVPNSLCEYPNEIEMRPDGGFVTAATQACEEFSECWVVLRGLTANGDLAMPRDKKVWEAGDRPLGLDVDARSRTLVAGQFHSRNHKATFGTLSRQLSNGKRDKSFKFNPYDKSTGNKGAKTKPRFGSFEEVIATGKGRVLAAGTINGRLLALQLRNNGKPDREFGRKGLFAIDVDGRKWCDCSVGSAMVRDRHLRILVAGFYFKNRSPKARAFPVLVRLTPDGKLDRTFGIRGITRLGVKDFAPNSIVVQSNGKIVISGMPLDGPVSPTFPALIRMTSNGQIDRTFFDDGLFALPTIDNGSVISQLWPEDMLLDREGRIVAAGTNEYGSSLLARIRPE